MKKTLLTFLGTRGYIQPTSSQHKMHTSLLITHQKNRIMIDCGETWEKHLYDLSPSSILLTHAHPDHAFGLKKGSPCPVWATRETWKAIRNFPIALEQRKILKRNTPIKIGGVTFTAHSVIHSIRAPAIGLRITASSKTFFYVPDVAWIPYRSRAFKGIDFYVGDGATIHRNMIRKDKKTGALFGHASISQQLTWCKKSHVPIMIITHLGSDIVSHKNASQKIEKLAQERDVNAQIAYDGMEITLESRSSF